MLVEGVEPRRQAARHRLGRPCGPSRLEALAPASLSLGRGPVRRAVRAPRGSSSSAAASVRAEGRSAGQQPRHAQPRPNRLPPAAPPRRGAERTQTAAACRRPARAARRARRAGHPTRAAAAGRDRRLRSRSRERPACVAGRELGRRPGTNNRSARSTADSAPLSSLRPGERRRPRQPGRRRAWRRTGRSPESARRGRAARVAARPPRREAEGRRKVAADRTRSKPRLWSGDHGLERLALALRRSPRPRRTAGVGASSRGRGPGERGAIRLRVRWPPTRVPRPPEAARGPVRGLPRRLRLRRGRSRLTCPRRIRILACEVGSRAVAAARSSCSQTRPGPARPSRASRRGWRGRRPAVGVARPRGQRTRRRSSATARSR